MKNAQIHIFPAAGSSLSIIFVDVLKKENLNYDILLIIDSVIYSCWGGITWTRVPQYRLSCLVLGLLIWRSVTNSINAKG